MSKKYNEEYAEVAPVIEEVTPEVEVTVEKTKEVAPKADNVKKKNKTTYVY